jgi:hypothetical protein
MCSDITETAAITGSAKGAAGWVTVDTATVYFDHPHASALEHTLNIDFLNRKEGMARSVAVELSAESALVLVEKIVSALRAGEEAHGALLQSAPAVVAALARDEG